MLSLASHLVFQLTAGAKFTAEKFIRQRAEPGKRSRVLLKDYYVYERERSSQQEAETPDSERAQQLVERLFDLLFPYWQPFAEGDKESKTWETSRSNDNLTFFCQWLVFEAPEDRADFFLSQGAALQAARESERERNRSKTGDRYEQKEKAPSAEEISRKIEEEFLNNPLYVDASGYLMGVCGQDEDAQLELFLKRRLSRRPLHP